MEGLGGLDTSGDGFFDFENVWFDFSDDFPFTFCGEGLGGLIFFELDSIEVIEELEAFFEGEVVGDGGGVAGEWREEEWNDKEEEG